MSLHFFLKLGVSSLTLMLFVACGSTVKQSPAVLTPIAQVASIGQAWQNTTTNRIEFALQMGVAGQNLAVAGMQGTVAVINTISGKDVWRLKIGSELSSGIGFDGSIAAVTTLDNELVAVRSGPNTGAIIWRQPMPARVYTAPLVAGGRIFVLSGERSVYAFDANTGAKLWALQRPSDPLILSQIGTLGVYRNTLIVGGSGRLSGVNPDNGQTLWETSVATTRATNDIERLIDLVGSPSRVGDSVCVRAYQASVACVDASKGQTLWTKNTQGSVGVSGDEERLISTESDGRVKAWNRASGELLWMMDKLTHRGLSAPLVVGNSVVIGDAFGYVHVLNKTDGSFTARFQTDSSAIAAAPVLSGTVVIVATAKGNLYAYSPK